MSSPTTAREGIKLSIIIASYNARTTLEKCLRALESQPDQEVFEVIVVDSSTDGASHLVAQQFPHVRLFTCAERKFPGDARNIGVSKATGAIIAFTDADCVVDRNWVRHILQAHANTPHPIIGGAVDNGNPESYIGWAYYFCEFSQWMPQTALGYMVEIPTTCLSVKRWAFDTYGPFLERTYCSDTAFNWQLGKQGFQPLFVPSIRVSHINITRLGNFLRRKVFHGTCFARVRMAEQEFSVWQRLVYVLLCPLLPFILWRRIASRVFRKGMYVKQFVLSWPLVFLGLVGWSWGELCGYLQGPYIRATHDVRAECPLPKERTDG
jgi:GT2 family glycosyltransferase